MTKLIPLVTGMVGPKLMEHGLPNVMVGIMQIQSVAAQDPAIGEAVGILTSATMGNIPDQAVIDACVAKL